jgi:outer membrane protein OmpA-like peptidoglycan-associated protein
MTDLDDRDPPALRFVTDAWPLLALGVIGALIIRACAPAHSAAPAAGFGPPFDVSTAARVANWHAMAALGALAPDASASQILEALNLPVIEFAPGSATLPEGAEPILARVAALIAARPQVERYEICGHTDGTGSPLADLELSRRRAQAVADFLVNQGVARERVQARGAGDAEPVAHDATDEARFRNRRLAFAMLP